MCVHSTSKYSWYCHRIDSEKYLLLKGPSRLSSQHMSKTSTRKELTLSNCWVSPVGARPVCAINPNPNILNWRLTRTSYRYLNTGDVATVTTRPSAINHQPPAILGGIHQISDQSLRCSTLIYLSLFPSAFHFINLTVNSIYTK